MYAMFNQGNQSNPFDGSFLAPWGANTAKEYAAPVGSAFAQAPSQFGQTKGQMYDSYQKGYGSYNQGLASLGKSFADNYAAMAGGTSGLANALGNTWNNAQAQNQANSAAAAAQQAAISNLGTAAMTSYGNVAGSGLQAWAQNQNGYQRASADMNVANQNAMSQLGIGRYNALAGLGKSGAAMQVGRDVSAALPGLAGTGGSGQGGGGYPSYGQYGGDGFGALNGLRSDINNGRELPALSNNYYAGMDSLNRDQDLARNMPRMMVGDARDALMDFNTLNLGASAQGMDQYYANSALSNQPSRPGQEIPTGSLLSALAGGYSDSANRIGNVQKDMNSGWGDAKAAYQTATDDVNNLYGNSIGNIGVFRSQPQIQQEQFAMQEAARARKKQEQDMQAAMLGDTLRRFSGPGNPNEYRPMPVQSPFWQVSPARGAR
jgi:hypothetical protein